MRFRSIEDNIGFRMKYRYGYYSSFLYAASRNTCTRLEHYILCGRLNIFRFQLLHVYNETSRTLEV